MNIATMQKTMSSREIAELTGSEHSNVLKTIRNLIAKGVVLGNVSSEQNKSEMMFL